ncbi:MAG: hypothetical protein KAU50_04170 [Candidatus Marinimicrobia bacterium]|nr:hypothetical protein [Candidatus Neomarinimicrobiota bacterium]
MVIIVLSTCTLPEGLGPVSGVEGELRIKGEWPDSIKAAALVVLDNLDLDKPVEHLITFSDPAMPGDTARQYFIQLQPGLYYMVAAGLTVAPSLFLANIDSFTTVPNPPIVILDDDLVAISTPVIISEHEIKEINRTIQF